MKALLGKSRLKFGSNVNLVFDGNSLVAGSNGASPMAPNAGNWTNVYVKPLLGFPGTIVNLGIGGQSWQNMTSAHADVDAAYVPGKTNVLVVLEDTNNITNGRNGTLTAGTDAPAYVAAVRASNPWQKIVVVTCSTRWSSTLTYGPFTHQQVSAETLVARSLYLANFKAYGFSAVADILQVGSPLIADYNTFATYSTTYYSTADTDAGGPVRLHWTDAGQAYVAGVIAQTLRRLAA